MSVQKEEVLDFDEALYQTHCEVCDDVIEWELNPDPDTPRYWGFCCAHQHTLTIKTVRHTVEDEGD